eukprot:4970930-Amphidinium_carterae.1
MDQLALSGISRQDTMNQLALSEGAGFRQNEMALTPLGTATAFQISTPVPTPRGGLTHRGRLVAGRVPPGRARTGPKG